MNTKHTPGPWEIVQDAPENPKARFQIGHRTSATGATYVCTIRTERCLTTDGNHEANAALIAAAPDLLAFAELYKSGSGTPAMLNQMCEAAIAKAKAQS